MTKPIAILHAVNLSRYARRGVGVTRTPLAECDGFTMFPGDRQPVTLGTDGRGVLVGDGASRRETGLSRTGTLSFDVGSFNPGRSSYPIELDLTDEALPPFRLHPWIVERFAGLRLTLTGEGVVIPLAMTPVGTSNFVAASRFTGRAPEGSPIEGFWASLVLETPTDAPLQRWALRVGFNDERLPDALDAIMADGFELEVCGAFPVVDYAKQRGIFPQRTDGGAYRIRLGGEGLWGDSQAPLVTGSLLYTSAPRELDTAADGVAAAWVLGEIDGMPLEYSCSAWSEAAAFGPFGVVHVPPLLADTEARQEAAFNAARRYIGELPTSGGLFAWGPNQCLEIPGTAGDQRDFGLAQVVEAVAAETPDVLHPIRFSVQTHSCRPGHYREQDVAPVAHAAHPQWYCYMHATHYHPSYSWDRLGKEPPRGGYRFARSDRGVIWKGHDPQHESINFLCGFALLRPEAWAIELVNDWIETALANYPTRSGTYLDGLGGTRAIGRTWLAMAWAHLATGRADILERAIGRLEINYAERAHSRASLVNVTPERRANGLVDTLEPLRSTLGGEISPTWTDGLPMPELVPLAIDSSPGAVFTAEGLSIGYDEESSRPLFVSQLFGPDGRSVPVANWSPWQEAFVAQGAAALWLLTGNKLAREVAAKVARTVLMYGVRPVEGGAFEVGGYLDYNDGMPLPDAAWSDPDRAAIYGPGVRRWILPAADIAAELWADDDGIRERALEFRQWCERDRSLRHGGFDEMVPWDVIREGLKG